MPSWATGDSWYLSIRNLKFIRRQKLNFMFVIDKQSHHFIGAWEVHSDTEI